MIQENRKNYDIEKREGENWKKKVFEKASGNSIQKTRKGWSRIEIRDTFFFFFFLSREKLVNMVTDTGSCIDLVVGDSGVADWLSPPPSPGNTRWSH